MKDKELNIEPSEDFLTNFRQTDKSMKIGADLFKKFFQVGIEAQKEKINRFQNNNISTEVKILVNETITLILDLKDWIKEFLIFYPIIEFRYDEFESLGEDKCEVRSGFEFMLDLFMNLNEQSEVFFKSLEPDIKPDFDYKIEHAKKCIEFTVEPEDISEFVPKSHVWWFKK